MASLTETLERVDRDEIIEDATRLIDDEVAKKGGFSGTVLKTGYKTVKKLKNGRMIEEAVDVLLDDFTDALDPLYQQFLDDDDYASFEAYLEDHPDRATDAMLSVTDERADDADNAVLAKTYGKLRGNAEGHVREALPAVGELVDEHAPKPDDASGG